MWIHMPHILVVSITTQSQLGGGGSRGRLSADHSEHPLVVAWELATEAIVTHLLSQQCVRELTRGKLLTWQ